MMLTLKHCLKYVTILNSCFYAIIKGEHRLAGPGVTGGAE